VPLKIQIFIGGPMIEEKSLVVQSNPLVQAQYKLTEAEHKLLRVLISMLQPETPGLEKRYYRVSIQDFAKFLGRTDMSDIYREVRRMAEALRHASLKVILPNGDTIRTYWIVAYKYPRNRGWIEFEFSGMLEEQLLKIKDQFTQYHLTNIKNLKGRYAIRLYELIQQFANTNCQSRQIDLRDLRLMLGIQDEHQKVSNLLADVIEPARREIKLKTDLYFSYRMIKDCRKFIGIEFYNIKMAQKRKKKSTL
jgi:plasmid replication initiation protein